MGQKNKHRLKAAPSWSDRVPRLLFDLATDEGLTKMRCLAISTGIQAAFEEKHQKLTLSHDAREAGALEIALKYEQVKMEGKRGTSDPQQFRELFYKLATRMHEAMLLYLKEEPLVYHKLAAMTPGQRNYHALFTAEKFVDQICAIPDDVPLTMSWF